MKLRIVLSRFFAAFVRILPIWLGAAHVAGFLHVHPLKNSLMHHLLHKLLSLIHSLYRSLFLNLLYPLDLSSQSSQSSSSSSPASPAPSSPSFSPVAEIPHSSDDDSANMEIVPDPPPATNPTTASDEESIHGVISDVNLLNSSAQSTDVDID